MATNGNNRTIQERRVITHFTYQKKGQVSVFYYPHPDGNDSLMQEALSDTSEAPPPGWYFRGIWKTATTDLKTMDGPFLTKDRARITAMAWALHHQQEEQQDVPHIWADRQKKRRL